MNFILSNAYPRLTASSYTAARYWETALSGDVNAWTCQAVDDFYTLLSHFVKQPLQAVFPASGQQIPEDQDTLDEVTISALSKCLCG